MSLRLKRTHKLQVQWNLDLRKNLNLRKIVTTVKLGNKELFGHPKIVPTCQKFLIANIKPK